MIPRAALLIAFVVLLAGTVATMIVLGHHGAPLKTIGGHKILALELAPATARAATIVDAWKKKGLLDLAREDIRFDYAFIALYTVTLALCSFFGTIVWGDALGGWLARAGTALGWAMFVAGLMDVFENIGMSAELDGRYAVAPFVCVASAIKWIITAAALLYSLPTLLMMTIRIPLLLRQDRVHGHADRGRGVHR